MTDSEVYNASMTYHAKVAKKGCAADKAYWVGNSVPFVRRLTTKLS